MFDFNNSHKMETVKDKICRLTQSYLKLKTLQCCRKAQDYISFYKRVKL